jgi:hypothetical protein
MNHEMIDLNINPEEIVSHVQYKEHRGKIGRIEIGFVEKNEECRHGVGDTCIYENPYRRPAGVCEALLHVPELYTWRTAPGIPSLNGESRTNFTLHCPEPKGTVWEMRRIV